MTTDMRERLRMQLVTDEGLRLKPYVDTVGKTSIGIGRNLTDVGITASEAYLLLDHDIDRTFAALVKRFPQVLQLDDVRQAVLLAMAFNMGLDGLATFSRTLAAVWRGDYEAAAAGMIASQWAEQIGQRAIRLSNQMISGQWAAEGKLA